MASWRWRLVKKITRRRKAENVKKAVVLKLRMND
jgi:hypothetical protein